MSPPPLLLLLLLLQEVNELVQKVSGGDQPVSIFGDMAPKSNLARRIEPLLYSISLRLKVCFSKLGYFVRNSLLWSIILEPPTIHSIILVTFTDFAVISVVV